MSKKHWNNHVAQSTEGDNPTEEQSTMNNEESTMEQQVEQSTEHVEGAETEQEQVVEQSTAPVVQVTMGIGQFCRHMMLNSSKSNTEILAMVLKLYPEAKTTAACIAWYKSDLRKKGLLVGENAVRSTVKIEFTPEMLAEMVK
jgi:hypothetical protein